MSANLSNKFNLIKGKLMDAGCWFVDHGIWLAHGFRHAANGIELKAEC
jgi:hypothetical protein